MALQIKMTADIIDLTDSISYIHSSKNPLSSDVVFIKRQKSVWIFDVGACKEAATEIEHIYKKKYVVLSHFHPDHIWNLICTSNTELFLSENTRKYVKKGTVVDKELVIPAEGKDPEIRVFEIPSSHAKGCLALVCGDYAFLGDATYSKEKFNKKFYNEQQLRELIQCLKKLDCQFVCLSHSRSFVHKREDIIRMLTAIYETREKGSAEICVDNFFYDDVLLNNEFDDENEDGDD